MGTRMNYGKAAPGAMRAMNGLETYNRRLEICLGSVLILTAALLFSGWRARGRKRTLSPREIQDQTVQAVLSQTACA